MDQNTQPKSTDQVSVVDVIKMFRGKLKLLVCLALVGVIIGGALGVLVSETSASYGATVNFYLTTQDGTKALLPLLQSEAFAEKLLLDENGLPPKAECNAADYDAALAAVKAHNEARALKRDLARKLSLIPYELAPIEEKFNSLTLEYTRVFNLLTTYKSAPIEQIADDKNHAEQVAKYEALLAKVEAERNEYKTNVYDVKIAEKLELEQNMAIAKRLVTDTRREEEIALEKVLSPWREKDSVREMVALIQDSVSYEYAKIIDDVATNTEENQNSAFLIINVDVNENEANAEYVIDRLKARTPAFVEKNIERLTGANEPQCTLISTFVETHRTDDNGLVMSAVVYGVIGAIVLVAFASIVIIVKGVLPDDIFAKKEKKPKKAKAAEKE